ncbi:unnamed protein product [Effrenium voratum]|uniref:Uncharacterized protein n=1 Tax=Effrenium voratum TaxID=2562239 RepID=A0AA36NJY7_9DINO|nr:unnamed protein product [Effrenium voratum]CAJ1426732.1 unnamed protein product [Effrenium voratum]
MAAQAASLNIVLVTGQREACRKVQSESLEADARQPQQLEQQPGDQPENVSAAANELQPQARRVTFELTADGSSETEADASRPEVARGFTMRSRLSSWRIPEASDKMPLYVQRAFRVKIFALLAFQQAACFLMMVGIHALILVEVGPHVERSLTVQAVYYMLSFADMIILMKLWMVRDSYPCNYLLLTVMTLLSGSLWGLTETILLTKLHLYIIGIVSLAMAVAAAVSFLLTSTYGSEKDVLIPLFTGWAAGSAAVLTVALTLFRISWEPFAACGFVGGLVLLLVLETQQFLFSSKPDNVMGIIVILNASLLSIVSIPFCVILFGFLYVSQSEENAEAPAVPELPASAEP